MSISKLELKRLPKAVTNATRRFAGQLHETGDRFRFLVDSDARKEQQYIVDLLKGEQGECTCPHFQIRLKGSDEMCKHLVKAKLICWDKFMLEVKAQMRKQKRSFEQEF